MDFESISFWIEHHPGMASWVQAVGSILAILAAGWFPFAHERAREKRQRASVLKSLLHLSKSLTDLQIRLLKSLSSDEWSERWVNGDGSRELSLIGQLISEIPASMLVGFEMSYLADLRFCAESANDADKMLTLGQTHPLNSVFDMNEVRNNHKSKLDQVGRLILCLEGDLLRLGY